MSFEDNNPNWLFNNGKHLTYQRLRCDPSDIYFCGKNDCCSGLEFFELT